MYNTFASSHFCLALLMGVGIYVGVQHLWFWHSGRRADSHLWVVGFCASIVLLTAGRYMDVSAEEPAAGLRAARLQAVAGPFIIYSLVGFGRSLTERPWSRSAMLALLGFSVALAALSYWPNLMIADAPFVDTDWFGRRHHSAKGSSGLLLLLAYAVAACALVLRDLSAARNLHARERRALVLAMSVFAVMGGVSILSAMEWVQIPMMSQFGLVVVACALSYVLVSEHLRLQVELERRFEEKTAELQESESAYRRLVQNAPLGILACSPEGTLVAANPHMLRMVGGLEDEASITPMGDHAISLFELQRVIDSGMAEMLKACARSGQPSQGDIEFRSRRGVDVELRLHVAPICDASGEIRAVQAIAEEIGERKALEERLRQSQKLEAVGRLAAGIAHEINNPMSYVRANLSMLRGEWTRLRGEILARCGPDSVERAMKDCEELIDESLEGVERTVALVRDVKEFSHNRSDHRAEAKLSEILEDSLRMASHRIESGVRVERDFADLPELSCSPAQLRQVFSNLIDNALHAIGGAGTLRVSTRRQGDEAVTRIEDDGGGIPPEIVEQLFDPFFTTKEAGEGTGLGLYIAYEIVRIHEGILRVDPKHGDGTCFEVRLPLAKQEPDGESA